MPTSNVDRSESGRQFVPALHGLRGLMALWVVLNHTTPNGIGPINVTFYGFFAVDVFFILSGYVLMHGHGRDFLHIRRRQTVEFFKARFWRTYPLYLASVILSVALYAVIHNTLPPGGHVLESLLILERWALPGIGLNVPVWSLGVEWLGYFAFPVIALSVARFLHRPIVTLVLTVLTCSVTTICIDHFNPNWNNSAGWLTIVRMAGGFTSGCLLYGLHQIAKNAAYWQGDLWVALGLSGFVALTMLGTPNFCLPLLVLGVFGVAHSRGIVSRVLSSGPFLFLGRISFALYLLHVLVMEAVLWTSGRPAGLVGKAAGTGAVLLGSILLSWLACVYLEEPARLWRRRVRALHATT